MAKAVRVGRPIVAGEAVMSSAKLLYANPRMVLPQLILLVPTLIIDGLAGSIISPLGIVFSLASAVLTIIVAGAYPSMVKTVLEGGQFSIGEALGRAYHRFWSLLGAGMLVAIIVGLGFVALVVPGIILATWYAYTVPAIMLEEKGALEGMAASKAFGRDKKGDTFLIFLAFFLAAIVLLGLRSLLSLAWPPLGWLVYAVLDLPLNAWISVVLAYTYITYGKPAELQANEAVSGLRGDIRNSFKAKGLEYISLSESSDPGKSVLTYKDGSGNMVTKEIGLPMPQLRETVTGLDAIHPEGLADYLLGPTLSQPAAQAVAPAATPRNFCGSCGSPVPAGSKFCPSCGKAV